MATLIKNISSLVTVKTDGKFRKGSEMQEIGEIQDGAFVFDDKILWVGTFDESEKAIFENNFIITDIIDAGWKTVMPGFVDSHTHLVFGGNRSDEFARRLRGATYQEIAASGGGIQLTVRATRNATIDDLAESGIQLALNGMRHGTTAYETKSGYGLSKESELKQLYAIKKMKETLPMIIEPTFLGAHDFPPEYAGNRDYYVDMICSEMLPQVAEERLATFCDAFIDEGYYTLAQGEKILRTALDYGLKLKVHCDELASFGAAELAATMGAISADHLIFASDAGIEAIAKSGTIATLLPGTSYFIRMPYAPARKFISAGAAVAISTDCNPGSCFTENLQLILSFCVINLRMTAEEAIVAATINGAAAIDKSEIIGSIQVGKRADFLVLDCPSYTDLFYHYGVNHVAETWCNGKRINDFR
jgi:imidazolonepropionase